MNFYKKILQKLEDNQKIYLLTVVDNIGSSPGRRGFKMMVSEDDFISGSIGGGIMEYQFVEKVKKDLQADKLEILFKRQIHQGSAKNSSGMICSGEQTVVFHPLDKKDIPTITQIISSLEIHGKGILELNAKGIFFAEEKQMESQYSFKNKEEWFFKEQIGYKSIFYIVGAGHVGLATSEIIKKLGFHIVIFDNRENLNTLEENNFVDEKHLVDYAKISNYIKPQNYIAIMTSKFVEDKLILSQLLKKPHKFLGVLGSKAKIKAMFAIMQEEGFTKKELESVYAPIGLPIKSQTPEEIAVSIAAQVITVRNFEL